MLIKNTYSCKKRKNHGISAKKHDKTRYFGKITAFDENHGLRDFRVSVIFYCPYLSATSLPKITEIG